MYLYCAWFTHRHTRDLFSTTINTFVYNPDTIWCDFVHDVMVPFQSKKLPPFHLTRRRTLGKGHRRWHREGFAGCEMESLMA